MRHRTGLAVAALLGAALTAPASAQFGSIFGDSPPRPPAGVPGGRQQPPEPSYRPPGDAPAYPPQSGYPASATPSGAIESRPLPAPGAAAVEPPSSEQAPRPRAAPQPADASPQPAEEVVTEPPAQKIVNSGALFTGLDKITGRIINFDVAIGETVQFGALQLTPRACYTRPSTESANTDAFIEVDEVTLQGEVRRIFTGWVFAASPGLHAIEHPIYDIWLTDCKSPVETAEKQPDPPAAAPAARSPQRAQQARQQPQRLPSARPQPAVAPPREGADPQLLFH